MKWVGKTIRDNSVKNVPCIGIATHCKVMQYHELDKFMQGCTTLGNYMVCPMSYNYHLMLVQYSAHEYAAKSPNSEEACFLNPYHTHFVLVRSGVNSWGEEIR